MYEAWLASGGRDATRSGRLGTISFTVSISDAALWSA